MRIAQSFWRGEVVVVLLVVVLLLLGGNKVKATAGNVATVNPVEIDDVLVNPGMGWETLADMGGDSTDSSMSIQFDKVENYPDSSIHYARWYWDVIEPQPGSIKFDLVDQAMAEAQERGQTLAFRIAPVNGSAPQWLRDKGCSGEEEPWVGCPKLYWWPNYGDPIFLEELEKLAKALGERYDGHPAIDSVDVGSVGHWGEWFTVPMPLPPFVVKKKIVDIWREAFPNTPLLMGIEGGVDVLEYAISRGCGWRGDCLGHWTHTGPKGFRYFERVEKAHATEAWKHVPVHLEVCHTMQGWIDMGPGSGHQEGEYPDPNYIFAQALKLHVSVLNGKWPVWKGKTAVPEGWWPIVNDFSRKMGYRLVLRQLRHPRTVSPGGKFRVEMKWENIGVAPCYKYYPLALQLQSQSGEVVWEGESKAADLRTWLPGSYRLQEDFQLPEALTPGVYQLRLAFLGYDSKPCLKLAIAGRDTDSWYSIGEVHVVEP